jgi:hypothetical protein
LLSLPWTLEQEGAMPEKSKRQKRSPGGSTPRGAAVVEPGQRAGEPPERHVQSPTAVAAEALITGVPPPSVTGPRGSEVPREGDLLRVGDVDTDAFQNANVGDEMPGGDMPTPDQDRVDDIGRAYGVAEADSGALRTSSELLDERDRRRFELEGPRAPHGTRDADRERDT